MPPDPQILAFLNADPLRHLVQLKYLHLYADEVRCFNHIDAQSLGVLISHVPAMTSWDAQSYGAANQILLPVATDARAAEALCNYALENFSSGPLVFKFCDHQTRAVFEHAFQLRHAKTLISYTAEHLESILSVADVIISDTLDEKCRYLYEKNGYMPEELHKFFSNGAKSFTIYEQIEPVCSCLIYRNFGSVWEVGGVHTIERARRQGYARRVVAAALKEIYAQGWQPRYQVDQTNLGSIHLAESLGLVPCLYFEHYWGSAVSRLG